MELPDKRVVFLSKCRGESILTFKILKILFISEFRTASAKAFRKHFESIFVMLSHWQFEIYYIEQFKSRNANAKAFRKQFESIFEMLSQKTSLYELRSSKFVMQHFESITKQGKDS